MCSLQSSDTVDNCGWHKRFISDARVFHMSLHSELSDRETAVEFVRELRTEALASQPTRTVALTDSFEYKALATDIIAETAVPEDSHATMDGFAVDASLSPPYPLVSGEVFPEDSADAIESGAAVRVATGAPVPPETNAVMKVEDTTVTDGRVDGPKLEPGTYVYERGTNVAAGETLFDAGERLSPKDAILLRDLGYESVTVRRPFDVGLLATGTEIHEGRSDDLDSPMLAGLIRSWGHAPTIEGTVPDEYDRVVERIDATATERDVVVTTGGTSVGKKDHVVRALRSLGNVLFHGVSVRPGKPIAAAELPDHDAVAFAIPGKPVGAHAITTLVARPFFTGNDSLPTVPAVATEDVAIPTEGFDYAVPVTLHAGESERRAEPLGASSSPLAVYEDTFDPSVLSSSTRATRADGFVITRGGFDVGEQVGVVPYPVVE